MALGATILVVDDDPLVRRTVERTLGRAGYDVRVAGSGAEALTALQAGTVDLLLSDVMMDDIEGPALLVAARAHQPSVPVLFMSGETPENLPLVGLDKQTTPFLEKPFGPQELLAAVQSLIVYQS